MKAKTRKRKIDVTEEQPDIPDLVPKDITLPTDGLTVTIFFFLLFFSLLFLANGEEEGKVVSKEELQRGNSDAFPEFDPYGYDSEDSENERTLMTIGNVPLEWYDGFDHFGYDLEGFFPFLFFSFLREMMVTSYPCMRS